MSRVARGVGAGVSYHMGDARGDRGVCEEDVRGGKGPLYFFVKKQSKTFGCA